MMSSLYQRVNSMLRGVNQRKSHANGLNQRGALTTILPPFPPASATVFDSNCNKETHEAHRTSHVETSDALAGNTRIYRPQIASRGLTCAWVKCVMARLGKVVHARKGRVEKPALGDVNVTLGYRILSTCQARATKLPTREEARARE